MLLTVSVEEIPVEKGEFTCLRYGWPTKKLVPAGPGPCRGRSSTDNHRSNYHLAQARADLGGQKAV